MKYLNLSEYLSFLSHVFHLHCQTRPMPSVISVVRCPYSLSSLTGVYITEHISHSLLLLSFPSLYFFNVNNSSSTTPGRKTEWNKALIMEKKNMKP